MLDVLIIQEPTRCRRICIVRSISAKKSGGEKILSFCGPSFPAYLHIASALSYWLYVGLIRWTRASSRRCITRIRVTSRWQESCSTKLSCVTDNAQPPWLERFPHYGANISFPDIKQKKRSASKSIFLWIGFVMRTKIFYFQCCKRVKNITKV